ncbi:MAG TPA: SpoIIE family protein phosphatase [Kofleriaceae bacterium]|nr:SpoIIE family protein phosphatase [Kofleriaceae bacterium]
MAVVMEAPVNARQARILVVDDDDAILGTIKRYLRQYAIEVTDCVEGALRELEHDRYDLLLLDRRLPDGLGDVVIENLRQRRSSLPIIMMSGEIDPQLHHQAPRHHADDFIEKPFVREALVTKIERLLTAHALRRQAAQQRAELAELHARREAEVEVARTIFDRIFARGEFDPAHVRHLVLPADRLAGDVVFGASPGPDRYRWMIGDVTGHTLSSALVTVPLAGMFYATTRDHESFAGSLAMMERELGAMLPPSMFCVGAMCEIDRRSATLQVWNGGNPDVLVRRTTGEVVQIPSTGMPLAADRFAPVSHPTVELAVAPGDRVYAFSDGLIELRDRTQQMVGFDRLAQIARAAPPEAIFGRMLDCIPDHTGAVGYDDDISLIEVIV